MNPERPSSSSRRLRPSSMPPPTLSAAYLERPGNRNDIIRRLRTIVEALGDENVEPNSPEYPELGGLTAMLVQDQFLNHKDKEVRLYTILACMEIFYIYAPEPPWDEAEIISIFHQMIRQLANLAHCTSPSQTNYSNYFRILEQLSEVKIGVVLVDIVRIESDAQQEALETLCDLIRTIISCVHVDHPPGVAAHAEGAVSACIEEFDGIIPIPVLDEILVYIGPGPIQYVTNPAAVKAAASIASSKKKVKTPPLSDASRLPPTQIQQTNPSYYVAAKIVRKTEDKISSLIASLLNGLLNGDPNTVEKTSISSLDIGSDLVKCTKGNIPTSSVNNVVHTGADVWSITYELHRIAPQILTTVIGTVASSLLRPEFDSRLRSTRLLGRLFAARTSDIAARFRPCFREWIRRSADTETQIRETMVKCLVNFLNNKSNEQELCEYVTEALATMITKDPNLDVRLLSIHQVCDLAHKASDAISNESPHSVSSAAAAPSPSINIISSELLKAVGNRVSSKDKTERRDAITGLAQIFHKHYIRKKLRHVQECGDGCNVGAVMQALRNNNNLRTQDSNSTLLVQDKYDWIPQKVFECVCFSDFTDPDMRNRIFQIVDDVLLGSGRHDEKSNCTESLGNSDLTPISRAVGLTLILDSLKDKDNAFRWLCSLFSQRSHLQRALGAYLEACVKAKETEPGSAEGFAADAEAMEKLETAASLSAPLSLSHSPNNNHDLSTVLRKFHAAKDKHIFRILSTIASPTHSLAERSRAFEELSKRTRYLGNVTSSWVRSLARRCAMGTFFDIRSIETCIKLARECFSEADFEAASLLLHSVKTATSIFPSLGATKDGLKNLVELFGECSSNLSPILKKGMELHGVLTMTSDILAKSISCRSTTVCFSKPPLNKKNSKDDVSFVHGTLRSQLLRLCTRDGTPEQAKNSIYAISSLVNPLSLQSSDITSRVRNEKAEFEPILRALVSPSRLKVLEEEASPKQRTKLVSTLSALAAVADCAPYAFNSPGEGATNFGWGMRAIEFTLGTIILGKDSATGGVPETSDNSSSDNECDLSERKPNRSKSTKGQQSRANTESPKSNSNVIDTSIHCQRICAGIELIVCHIRSTLVRIKSDSLLLGIAVNPNELNHSEVVTLIAPSPEHITNVFTTLVNIIEHAVFPTTLKGGRFSKLTLDDHAELRRCAAISLLRLCDANLQLEPKYLSPHMWHVLSSAFLDAEHSVRESVMEELSFMLTGSGKFRHATPFSPSLRFVAIVTLCADGDYGAVAANGQAANVGRTSNRIKFTATQCIKSLRKTCQATQAQCRSLGRDAENNFENRLKMKIMPEYCVPFALHLLAFRHETPSAAAALAGEEVSDREDGKDDELVTIEAASLRILKKRLKWLFDPLILSLGDGADNISFLLRMVELIGSKHRPLDYLKPIDVLTENGVDQADTARDKESAAKLKIICQLAREVLLSYVKKDVNLSLYPGSIQIPGDLFARVTYPRSPIISRAGKRSPNLEENKMKLKRTPNKNVTRGESHRKSISRKRLGPIVSTTGSGRPSKKGKNENPQFGHKNKLNSDATNSETSSHSSFGSREMVKRNGTLNSPCQMSIPTELHIHSVPLGRNTCDNEGNSKQKRISHCSSTLPETQSKLCSSSVLHGGTPPGKKSKASDHPTNSGVLSDRAAKRRASTKSRLLPNIDDTTYDWGDVSPIAKATTSPPCSLVPLNSRSVERVRKLPKKRLPASAKPKHSQHTKTKLPASIKSPKFTDQHSAQSKKMQPEKASPVLKSRPKSTATISIMSASPYNKKLSRQLNLKSSQESSPSTTSPSDTSSKVSPARRKKSVKSPASKAPRRSLRIKSAPKS